MLQVIDKVQGLQVVPEIIVNLLGKFSHQRLANKNEHMAEDQLLPINRNRKIRPCHFHDIAFSWEGSTALPNKVSQLCGQLHVRTPSAALPAYDRFVEILCLFLSEHASEATWENLISSLRFLKLNNDALELEGLADSVLQRNPSLADEPSGPNGWPRHRPRSSRSSRGLVLTVAAACVVAFGLGWLLCAVTSQGGETVTCQPCNECIAPNVPPSEQQQTQSVPKGTISPTAPQGSLSHPIVVTQPNGQPLPQPFSPTTTKPSYSRIRINDPKRIPNRVCNRHFNITFDLQESICWSTLAYPPQGECESVGDKVTLTGSSSVQNIDFVLCKVGKSTISLTFSNLSTNLDNLNIVCSSPNNKHDGCTGAVMDQIEELQVFQLNIASSSNIFELLQPLEFPRLERIALEGLPISGYNVQAVRKVIKKSASTLKVLDVFAMASSQNPGLAIVTDEICEQFRPHFKIMIDWRNKNADCLNFVQNIRSHSKCLPFLTNH